MNSTHIRNIWKRKCIPNSHTTWLTVFSAAQFKQQLPSVAIREQHQFSVQSFSSHSMPTLGTTWSHPVFSIAIVGSVFSHYKKWNLLKMICYMGRRYNATAMWGCRTTTKTFLIEDDFISGVTPTYLQFYRFGKACYL